MKIVIKESQIGKLLFEISKKNNLLEEDSFDMYREAINSFVKVGVDKAYAIQSINDLDIGIDLKNKLLSYLETAYKTIKRNIVRKITDKKNNPKQDNTPSKNKNDDKSRTTKNNNNHGTSVVSRTIDMDNNDEYGGKENNGQHTSSTIVNKVVAYINDHITKVIKRGKGGLPSGYKKIDAYAEKIGTAMCVKCANAHFNLILTMATAQLESSYGVSGAARRTGQIFNINQYKNDDGTTHYASKTSQEHSIDMYIDLIKRRYPGWKNINKFLSEYGYCNDKGSCYGGRKAKKTYGPKVREIYNQIQRELTK